VIRPAGGGGVFAFWHAPVSSGNARVTSEGGIVHIAAGANDGTGPLGVGTDGSGAYLEAFTGFFDYPSTNHIEFVRVTPEGAADPPGVHLAHENSATAGGQYPSVTSDPGAGAYIGWVGSGGAYFVQRVTTAGTIAPGWSTRGRRLGTSPIFREAPALLSDGSSGVFVLASADFMRVWRVQSDTSLASGWPAIGVPLSTGSYFPASTGDWSESYNLALVAGPAGHTFAVWFETDGVTYSQGRVAARSFDGAGNLDGPVVALSDYYSDIASLTAQSDGQGGMLVHWLQGGVPSLAHVLANGTVGAQFTNTAGQAVASGRNGGFIMFWSDLAGLWGQWYLADGTPDPSEPVNPRFLYAADPARFGVDPRAAYTDGDGGAYLLFVKSAIYSNSAWMLHASRSNTLRGVKRRPMPLSGEADAGATPRGSRFALAVASNPARGELRLGMTISHDQDASIELLDVAGRRVLTRNLPAGASLREERIALPSGLPSGVYLVRLRQGLRATLQHVAIIQ